MLPYISQVKFVVDNLVLFNFDFFNLTETTLHFVEFPLADFFPIFEGITDLPSITLCLIFLRLFSKLFETQTSLF